MIRELSDFRKLARALLPKPASLKRDRGDMLFITDAPKYNWNMDDDRFIIEYSGNTARLSPSPILINGYAENSPVIPDFLMKTCERFKGAIEDNEIVSLFIMGVKVYETLDKRAFELFDARLRRLIAKSLRERAGIGLYACCIQRKEIMDIKK